VQKGALSFIWDLNWRRELTRAAGALGLRSALYRSYCRLAGPNGGTVHVEVSGKSAEFYVHDSATLEKLSRFGGEEHLLAVLMAIHSTISAQKSGCTRYFFPKL
jgi:hypothetical protein